MGFGIASRVLRASQRQTHNCQQAGTRSRRVSGREYESRDWFPGVALGRSGGPGSGVKKPDRRLRGASARRWDAHRGWPRGIRQGGVLEARSKIPDTLVETSGDAASDAGSTPAASTKLVFARPSAIAWSNAAEPGYRVGGGLMPQRVRSRRVYSQLAALCVAALALFPAPSVAAKPISLDDCLARVNDTPSKLVECIQTKGLWKH